jgi:hypothetical protein
MARPRVYKLTGASGALKNYKIYYTGFSEQPKFLGKTGRGFSGLKHMIELLQKSLRNFTLTITPAEDSISRKDKSLAVRVSAKTIRRLGQKGWTAKRDLNLRLVADLLSETFPDKFPSGQAMVPYRRGMFADFLKPGFDARLLSVEDRKALTELATGQILSGTKIGLDTSSAYKVARDVQLLYMRNMVADFEKSTAANHEESWWQTYFDRNILFFQSSYVTRLEKMNIDVAGTRFPDFMVLTADGYLDIIEIKKPATDLLKEDTSRHNYYWSVEIAKAISQVENYIDSVTKHADALRSALRDKHGIDLQIIKPRGIVVAGLRAEQFSSNIKKAGDFRRLNEGLKNVQILPYDELSSNMRNTIVAIEKLAGASADKKSKRTSRTEAA